MDKLRPLDRRWYRRHQQAYIDAVQKYKKRSAWAITSLMVLIVLLCSSGWAFMAYTDQKRQKSRDITKDAIVEIIMESNPEHDPVYAEAAANYLIENSRGFNPIFLAAVAKWESSWDSKARSQVGAEGLWQPLPTKKDKEKYTPTERLHLEYQLNKAIDKLEEFWNNGHCIRVKSKGRLVRICGQNKYTTYGMHRGYVGGITNTDTVNYYMAMIYWTFADKTGCIWKNGKPLVATPEGGEDND